MNGTTVYAAQMKKVCQTKCTPTLPSKRKMLANSQSGDADQHLREYLEDFQQVHSKAWKTNPASQPLQASVSLPGVLALRANQKPANSPVPGYICPIL